MSIAWLGLLALLGVGLGVYWLGLVAWTAWSLTHPHRRGYAWAVSRGTASDPSELDGSPEYESFEVRGRRGMLPVWRIKGELEGGPVIVLSHGWADSRVGMLSRVEWALKRCRAVVLWDMPGNGEAGGACRLGAREADDLCVLLDELGEDCVVLWGRSLGAGVSIEVAAGRAQVVGVIAEGAYVSQATPARNVLAARGLPWKSNLGPALWIIGLLGGVGITWRGFDRCARAGQLDHTPLLVIHGTEDVVSPLEDGRAIAAAAPHGSIAVIEGGTHNTLWTDPASKAACEAAVSGFLGSLAGAH